MLWTSPAGFVELDPHTQLIPIMVPAMFGFGANIKISAGEKNYRVSGRLMLPVATTHELADALAAVVAGRAVENPKTKPVGCFISYVE